MLQVPKSELIVAHQSEQSENSKSQMKRYSLVSSSNLFDGVQALVSKKTISASELLKHLIKIGLAVGKLCQCPDVHLIVRERNRECELILLNNNLTLRIKYSHFPQQADESSPLHFSVKASFSSVRYGRGGYRLPSILIKFLDGLHIFAVKGNGMSQSVKKELKSAYNSEQENNSKSRVKRYNLVLPNNLFDEVQVMAYKENISVLELLKRFIKIGLVINKLCQSPDASLIVREGNRERELVLL